MFRMQAVPVTAKDNNVSPLSTFFSNTPESLEVRAKSHPLPLFQPAHPSFLALFADPFRLASDARAFVTLTPSIPAPAPYLSAAHFAAVGHFSTTTAALS